MTSITDLTFAASLPDGRFLMAEYVKDAQRVTVGDEFCEYVFTSDFVDYTLEGCQPMLDALSNPDFTEDDLNAAWAAMEEKAAKGY